ncbi:hypothetical protein [Microbacterium sp. NPDC089695]|uniref:hypothetical protein n=1 Tax=Microbacterium sp. NPDC089695 TaxID=3364198 RepID=UPI00381316A9
MTSSSRAVTALSLLAAALLFAGCASDAPGSSTPTSSPGSSAGAVDGDDMDDMEGALLDDGRMFAVVTWGSSTCVPQVDEVTANGQTVSVSLVDVDADAVCTADMQQRASVGALPDGVDPTQDITLQVTYGDLSDVVDLDGDPEATGTPGSSTEYLPSAGWVDDGTLVLLTWGSSSCAPIVESLDAATLTATFVTDDTRMCTMDMAPRVTLLAFGDDAVDDDATTLTLVGDALDGTVEIRG